MYIYIYIYKTIFALYENKTGKIRELTILRPTDL